VWCVWKLQAWMHVFFGWSNTLIGSFLHWSWTCIFSALVGTSESTGVQILESREMLAVVQHYKAVPENQKPVGTENRRCENHSQITCMPHRISVNGEALDVDNLRRMQTNHLVVCSLCRIAGQGARPISEHEVMCPTVLRTSRIASAEEATPTQRCSCAGEQVVARGKPGHRAAFLSAARLPSTGERVMCPQCTSESAKAASGGR
jgi:hypothetical protein